MTDAKTISTLSIVLLVVGFLSGMLTFKQCSTPKEVVRTDTVRTVVHDTVTEATVKYVTRKEMIVDTLLQFPDEDVYAKLDSVIMAHESLLDVMAESTVDGPGYSLLMQYYLRQRKFEHHISFTDTTRTVHVENTECEPTFWDQFFKYGFYVVAGAAASLLLINQ